MASLNRIVRFNNQCGLECKIVQGRGSIFGADEVIIPSGSDATFTFRGVAIGSTFTVIVSGGPQSGTEFKVSSQEITILSSGPITIYGNASGNASLAAMACDNQRLIATPLSYLKPRGQVIGVSTPGLTPGMTCDVTPDEGGDSGDGTEQSFWEKNRVWIIILIALSVLLLLGAIILAIFLGMRSRKKAKRVTSVDDDGNTIVTTTTILEDD